MEKRYHSDWERRRERERSRREGGEEQQQQEEELVVVGYWCCLLLYTHIGMRDVWQSERGSDEGSRNEPTRRRRASWW